jgi:hypothetical protein
VTAFGNALPSFSTVNYILRNTPRDNLHDFVCQLQSKIKFHLEGMQEYESRTLNGYSSAAFDGSSSVVSTIAVLVATGNSADPNKSPNDCLLVVECNDDDVDVAVVVAIVYRFSYLFNPHFDDKNGSTITYPSTVDTNCIDAVISSTRNNSCLIIEFILGTRRSTTIWLLALCNKQIYLSELIDNESTKIQQQPLRHLE